MAKTSWSNATFSLPDPGRIIELSEISKPTGWVGPREQERRRVERQKIEQERLKRVALLQVWELSKPAFKAVSRKQARGNSLTEFEKYIWEHGRDLKRQLGL